ncbi:MAG: c-type cytochrome [Persephonella sp.]|nr:c-type cytochrome [Persephonella sp.]
MYKKILSVIVGTSLIISCQQETKTGTEQTKTKKETVQQEAEKVSASSQEKKTVIQTDGESIFKVKGCASCHQPDVDTVGPSLKRIAQAYRSQSEQLTRFLKGQEKPIVDPSKFRVMKPQLNVTKSMSDRELSDMVNYIMKH